MQIPFVGGAYLGRSTAIDTSQSINFFVEMSADQTAKAPLSLVGTCGVKLWQRFGTAPIRGLYRFGGYLFVVCGTALYRVDVDGNTSTVGSLNTDTGSVYFTDNGIAAAGVGGNQMLILDYTYAYVYDLLDNTIQVHPSANFPTAAVTAAYMDGYVVAAKDSMGITVSELYDLSTYNGLAIAAAIATPDNIRTIVNLHQQLFIIKEFATEVWYNTGTATQDGCPFARVSGAVIDYGTAAAKSTARGDNSLFFLANQRVGDGTGSFIGVVQLQGYTPTVVSPPSIVYRMTQMTDMASAEAFCYVSEGHLFYQVTFPNDNATFVYDASTKLWHERSTYTDKTEVEFDTDGYPTPKMLLPNKTNRHLASCYVFYDGMHLVGDYRTGNVYEMSSQYYDDNTEPIISTRITPLLTDKTNTDPIFISRVTVDMESGAGTGETYLNPYGTGYLADGSIFADGLHFAGSTIELTAGGNPSAFLSWSDDSGKTWSGEYEAAIGKQGEYLTRLIWRRLGAARNRAYKLRISSPIKKIITLASVEAAI